jgi:hypothetical protein
MRIGRAVLLGVILLVPSPGSTQVYRWEDQDALHFTNTYERVPAPHRDQVGPPLPVAPEPVAPPPTPPLSGVTKIPYSPGSPILVTASIGGAGSVTLILDTGADRTMVSPEALGRLGISYAEGPRAEIKGVTGTSQGSMVEVNSIEVGQAKVGPLRIVAHDADLKKADGLLGRDFLEHFTVTIDSKAQQVTLAPK